VPNRPLDADSHAIPGSLVYRVAGEPFSGRVWLVESKENQTRNHVPAGSRSCGDQRDVGGGYTMRCVELPEAHR
jgi:hypothetical protein